MGSLAGCCFGDSVNRFNIMRDKEREREREGEREESEEREKEREIFHGKKERRG